MFGGGGWRGGEDVDGGGWGGLCGLAHCAVDPVEAIIEDSVDSKSR